MYRTNKVSYSFIILCMNSSNLMKWVSFHLLYDDKYTISRSVRHYHSQFVHGYYTYISYHFICLWIKKFMYSTLQYYNTYVILVEENKTLYDIVSCWIICESANINWLNWSWIYFFYGNCNLNTSLSFNFFWLAYRVSMHWNIIRYRF